MASSAGPGALTTRSSCRRATPFLGAAEVVAVDDAVGRVSGESIAGYPPGIPALLPGERITAELVAYLRELRGRARGCTAPATRRSARSSCCAETAAAHSSPCPSTDSLIDRALAEDVGTGDVTTEATVPAGARACATIAQKAAGRDLRPRRRRGGLPPAGPGRGDRALGPEGVWREARCRVLRVAGAARALLTGERTALNFLGRLSGRRHR